MADVILERIDYWVHPAEGHSLALLREERRSGNGLRLRGWAPTAANAWDAAVLMEAQLHKTLEDLDIEWKIAVSPNDAPGVYDGDGRWHYSVVTRAPLSAETTEEAIERLAAARPALRLPDFGVPAKPLPEVVISGLPTEVYFAHCRRCDDVFLLTSPGRSCGCGKLHAARRFGGSITFASCGDWRILKCEAGALDRNEVKLSTFAECPPEESTL